MAELTLRQLEFFVASVDARSVTSAAHNLRVSAGSVSHAISQLEKSLNVQLLVRRRGYGIEVTPAGHWTYSEAKKVLEGAVGIFKAAQVSRGELAGSLKLGCFTTLSPWLIPRIVHFFAESFPGVDIEIIEGPTEELQALLRQGELDTALVYKNHLSTRVQAMEVVPVRLQLAVSLDHPLSDREHVYLRELENEDAILLGVEPAISHVEELMKSSGLRPRVRWRSKNVETIRSMVARGLGYTVIMGRPYGDLTYDGLPIVYKRIADEIEPNAVVLALPDGVAVSPKINELFNFCRREFGLEGDPSRTQGTSISSVMGEL